MVASPLRDAARRALLTVRAPMAKARLQRAVRSAPEPVALEVGGRAARSGWLVTDAGGQAGYRLDVTKPWPIDEGALSFVYADNIIEDLSLDGGRAFLAEAGRCLRPGGVIRLVTPDIGRHVELYLAGASAVQGAVASRYRSIGVVMEHPVDLMRAPIGGFGHHAGYVYDLEALTGELQRAGFGGIAQEPAGESDHPHLVGLEGGNDAGAYAQLVVEATR
jgi:hypothetical protein